MKKFVFFFIAILFAAGFAVAQDTGTKGMKGDGMEHGMGMMGMMKMMEQCNAMMMKTHLHRENASESALAFSKNDTHGAKLTAKNSRL